VPENADTRRLAAQARVAGAAPVENGQDIERRLDELLSKVKEDEDARQQFVDLLEVLGPDDPRTPEYRRALASRLY
jgi:putative thioredoxin